MKKSQNKPSISKSKNRIILSIILILLILGLLWIIFFNPFLTGNIVLSSYTDTGYAPPYNLYEGNAMIFRVSPEYLDATGNEFVTLDLNATLSGGYLYKEGYLYD